MKDVLLIDDDIMEQKLMHLFLTRRYDEDFELTYVDNLDAGLKALDDAEFDVVFIDHYLPPYKGAHETYPLISGHVRKASLIYISSGFTPVDRFPADKNLGFSFIDKFDIKDRIMNGLLDS